MPRYSHCKYSAINPTKPTEASHSHTCQRQEKASCIAWPLCVYLCQWIYVCKLASYMKVYMSGWICRQNCLRAKLIFSWKEPQGKSDLLWRTTNSWCTCISKDISRYWHLKGRSFHPMGVLINQRLTQHSGSAYCMDRGAVASAKWLYPEDSLDSCVVTPLQLWR
jgi:hypothetical protein